MQLKQIGVGVFPRCVECKRRRKAYAYCGTESAVRACLNWPPKEAAAGVGIQKKPVVVPSSPKILDKKAVETKKAGQAEKQSTGNAEKRKSKDAKGARPRLEPSKLAAQPGISGRQTDQMASAGDSTPMASETVSDGKGEEPEVSHPPEGWSISQLSALQVSTQNQSWLNYPDLKSLPLHCTLIFAFPR